VVKRTRLKAMSSKKRREIRESRPTVAEVFARDDFGCVLRRHQHLTGECRGDLQPHHIRKQSQKRGDWSHQVLVTTCWFHNCVWIEGNRDDAHDLGLVVGNGESLADAWQLMRAAGLAVGPQDIEEAP
jgi:hypothetical protein